MPDPKEVRQQLRNKIEASISKAQKDFQIRLQERRLLAVKSAAKALQQNRPVDAIKDLYQVLSLLETSAGVEPGGLMPSLFDPRQDVVTLLMICGIYWDIIRILDRSRSAKTEAEFNKALQKFVLFTKGMSYQSVGAETLRKHLKRGRVVHRDELVEAYRVITGQKPDTWCFVATSLADLTRPGTQESLRSFRDGYLRQRPWGRTAIARYYRVGYRVSLGLDRAPFWIRVFAAKSVDAVAWIVRRFQ